MSILIPIRKWMDENGVRPVRPDDDLLKTGGGDTLFLEHFRALRSKLEYKADMKGWKAFGVTSSVANEGKTLCCTKVAASMASTKRKKVLLVDADNRKADLSRGMGIAGLPGLTDFLLGTASLTDVIRKTSLNGLFTVSSGGDVPVPADLLAGERFRFFLEEARSVFDMLFLDLPPVIPVSDAMAVRDRLDGFIFIYRFGFTPITLFQQASEEIGEKKILGVVLNCAEPKSEKYYKNYYGKYYVSSKPGGKEEQE